MIIKSFLITLVFLIIKSITILILIIILLINKESEDILNCDKNDSEDRKGNYFLRPITLFSTPDDLPIATMLYYKYWNEVFNLTYFKIMIGRKNFWFKIFRKINLKTISKIIFYFFIGINKTFINITKEILNYKKKEKIEDFLFRKSINIIDDRLILKINGEWVINGFINETTHKVKNVLLSKNNLSTSSINSAVPHIYGVIKKHNDRLIKDFLNLKMEKGIFKNKISKKMHEHILEINKNHEYIGYITDQKKADINENYGLNVMLEKIELKKKSKLLEISKNEVSMIGKIKLKNPFPFLESARNNDYNEKIISDNFTEQISNYKEMRIDLYEDLKEIIQDEWSLKEIDEIIFKELINNFTRVINEI